MRDLPEILPVKKHSRDAHAGPYGRTSAQVFALSADLPHVQRLLRSQHNAHRSIRVQGVWKTLPGGPTAAGAHGECPFRRTAVRVCRMSGEAVQNVRRAANPYGLHAPEKQTVHVRLLLQELQTQGPPG